MKYVVLPMAHGDIPQVTEIEKETELTAWPSSSYQRELDNSRTRYLVAVGTDETTGEPLPAPATGEAASPVGRLLAGVRSLLSPPATANGRLILGFIGMWILFDEAHITTLAVREPHRRQGVGERLLLSAIDVAAALDAEVATLEVRVSNLGAQALYRKCGFHQSGLRRGYYTDNREDAMLMATDRITTASFQSHFAALKDQHREHWGSSGPGSNDEAG